MSNEARPALSPQLQIVYQDVVDNLRFMKRQQWMITNYLIALLAGLYVFRSDISPSTVSEKAILTTFAAVALFVGEGLLLAIQRDMVRARRRLAWFCRTYFTEKEQNELNLRPDPKPWHHDIFYLATLLGVALFVAAIVTWAIWR